MARKTADMSKLLETANRMLAAEDGPYMNADIRKGVAKLLEATLHETDTYAGFNYLEWMSGGFDRWVADGKPQDTTPYLGDQTRRHYFSSKIPTPKTLTGPTFDYPKAFG
jgi:hypothetical protein